MKTYNFSNQLFNGQHSINDKLQCELNGGLANGYTVSVATDDVTRS